MAKVTGLVGELRKQVTALEKDLRERVDGASEIVREEDTRERWKAEHSAALAADRTAASWQAWRDERVTQAAVAWVLVTVFARFCEDNDLVSKVWIAGPTPTRRREALDARSAYFQTNREDNDRHWLRQIVDHFASMRATSGLVDAYSPLHQVGPSGDAARRLLEFWWDQDSDGELLRRFGPDVNPELDTRFLGDLYQELSEFAKDYYALLQTPEFVEEFILDQTFESALAERQLEGFTVIDPTCGSGHFLLGAFRRLLDRWSKHAPNLDSRALVQKALDGVHGVDINPFAVAIARFRLVVAALQASGEKSLEQAPDFRVQLAAGDSLIYGARQTVLHDDLFSAADDDVFAYSIENGELLKEILHDHYDVVVGNPPYIKPKDKAQNGTYRKLYNYCKGTYALTVPFMELFFDLARSHGRPGWVGQITSNSFMKREFGAPVIEKFLARKELRMVIDSEGAWIPGHNSDGTPTVILIGTNRPPRVGIVRTVLSKGLREGKSAGNRGDGPYWSSITDHIGEPGFDNGWITVTDLDRALLEVHPWSLSGGGAVEALTSIESTSSKQLGERATRIGFMAMSHADDEFSRLPGDVRRNGLEPAVWLPLAVGQDVRDYWIFDELVTWFPYDSKELLKVERFEASSALLWQLRTQLASRATFGGGTYLTAGRPWYEWHQLPKDVNTSPLSIAFAEVATHNHFVLDRGGKVFKQTAPVVKLPEGATEDDHLELLGVLNSSAACFWLKQKCKPKGGAADWFWARTFQFNGTNVREFPLPAKLPFGRARRIDALAQELATHTPQAVAETGVPTKDALDSAYAEHQRIRAKMIAEQEELDWECYRLYGLIDEDLTYSGGLSGLDLGARAFEIVLARAMADGEDTAWFERHRSTPITEIPEHWPADYRELVQRRLDLIERDRNIRLLEKPEYKRRWAIEPWDKRVRAALKEWLLDRLEDRDLWFDRQGRPRPRSVAQLADIVGRDNEFTSVLGLWLGQPDVQVTAGLQELVADQAVPFLAAYRYKESGMDKRAAWEETWRLQRLEDAGETLDQPIAVPPKYKPADFQRNGYWQHRGKLDVPKERFIGYLEAGRETDSTPLLGWAGWDHAQQALALATIMHEREQDGWADERMVPLIAGLAELQPWVRQWHGEIDPTYGVSLAAIVDEELAARSQRAGKTTAQLAAWRPAKPARGRRKATSSGATSTTTRGATDE